MKKNIKIIILVIVMLLSFPISFGEDDLFIIKIGLSYTALGETPNENLIISTGEYFEFGQLLDSKYVKLFELNSLRAFNFEKDDYFHISIGTYNTYEEIFNAKVNYNNKNIVIVKNKNYQLYYGNYSSEAEAKNNIQAVLNDTGITGVVVNSNPNMVSVKSSGNTVLLIDSSYDFILAPVNSNLQNKYSSFGKNSYRGGFGPKRKNTNGVSVVNYVRIGEYLYGVVPREMSKTWPIEALKAQAIVARNYAIANMNKFSNYGFNLDATTNSQVYGGYNWEGPISNQAVNETEGLLLKYNDTIVNAYYHSNSGGFTENSENVWSAVVPYLKGIYDPYSLGFPNDYWSIKYTPTEINNILNNKKLGIGILYDFYIGEYTKNDRVFKAVFQGSNGEVVLDKEKIRSVFGYNTIKSTLLTVTPDNVIKVTDGVNIYSKRPKEIYVIDVKGKTSLLSSSLVVYNSLGNKTIDLNPSYYTIEGKGWGHGLGMSQFGAKGMAEQGYTYLDILTHYYTGTYIE